MLQRLLTALCLIPPVLAVVWYLDTVWVICVYAAFLLVGAWEWAGLMKLASSAARLAYVALIVILGTLAYLAIDNPQLVLILMGLAAVWWSAALLWILQYPKGMPESEPLVTLKAIVGVLVLVPSVPAVALLHQQGPEWVLVMFVIIWAADTGAYFAGRALGKRKLAPQVSPGKTWAGFFGGVVAGAVVAVLAVALFTDNQISLPIFALAAALVVVASVVGDLTESMFKRHADIKDSGNIFPGHGGVLDRLDSLFSAAPIFVLLLQCMR